MLQVSEEDEDFLRHAYDPQKAHDYYLRVRKLKGRRVGAGKDVGGKDHGPQANVVRPVHAFKPTKSSEARRQEAQQKLDALNERLDKLRDLLAQLVKKAKARSGDHTKSDSKKSSADGKTGGGSKDSKDRKPLTAKQKADARKRAKDSYEKNKKDKPDSTKEIEQKIADVKDKIRDIQKQIREARSNGTSNHKTAPKGR